MTFKPTFQKGNRVRVDGARFAAFQRACGNGRDVVVVFEGDTQPTSVPLDSIRHAPVLVVGGALPAIPTTCPDGHPISPQDVERVDPVTHARTPVRVVACGFCDFVQVLKK